MTTTTRRPSRARRSLVITLVLLVALAGAGAGGVWWLQRSLVGNIESLGDPFASIPDRPSLEPPAPGAVDDGERTGAPMNILVLGSDSRVDGTDPAMWEEGGQRTDTIMIAHVPADRTGVVLMSIPRDAWVDIPGHGSAKINAAFSWGGPSLAIATVENLTGLRMDHFVMTDFESFKDITDALGGVRLTLSRDLDAGGTIVRAGKQVLLTGEQALAFVRERKDLPRGDFDRVQRQQAWVRAMVAKMRNDGTMRNPVTAQRFLETVTNSIAADDGVDADFLADFRSLAVDLGSDDLTFLTVPYSGTSTTADGQSIVDLDRPALGSLMDAVRNDEAGAYLDANALSLELLPPVVG